MIAADKLALQSCCSRVPGTQPRGLPVHALPHRTAHSRACLRRMPGQACRNLAADSAAPEAAQLDTLRAQVDAAVQTDASDVAGASGLQPEPARAPPVLRSRLEVRRQASVLTANPLSFAPVHRAGAFSGGSGLDSGGAVTLSMVAHAVGTSVEQVSCLRTRLLGLGSAQLTASQAWAVACCEIYCKSGTLAASALPGSPDSLQSRAGRADACSLPAQSSA